MKLAVVFPGIGYHVDKPLLYYSKKIAARYGYEIVDVSYGNFPSGVKGSKEKMEQAFHSALTQCEEILKDVEFERCGDILFLSKSVGTAVASAFGEKRNLRTRNVYYTPVEASFTVMNQPGIVFHGTNDQWLEDTGLLLEKCRERNFPVYLVKDGNHSLETGNVREDLKNMQEIMRITEAYIKGI